MGPMLVEVRDTRQDYIDKLTEVQNSIREGAYPFAVTVQVHRIDGTVTTSYKYEPGANIFQVIGALKVVENAFSRLIR